MNITIYSTTDCAACHNLTDWLTQNGQAYTKKNVDTDSSAMDEFMAVNDGMIGVPFTVITDNGDIISKISGFKAKDFKDILHD